MYKYTKQDALIEYPQANHLNISIHQHALLYENPSRCSTSAARSKRYQHDLLQPTVWG